MELKITRLQLGDACLYLADTGKGKRSGMPPSGLKALLLDLGVGNSTIAAVLKMSPDETMSVQVTDKAA
jgi:hypothetical protein